MTLTTRAAVKLRLGLTNAQSDQDGLIDELVLAADGAVKRWTHREVLESQAVTLFLSGSGKPDLLLPHRPVTSVTSVHVDHDGYWGTGAGAFPADTLWTEGTHYALVRDSGGVGAAGKSAVLRRLGGVFPAGSFWPYHPYPAAGPPGLLAARPSPYWPVGEGNVKVVVVAGYSPVPPDLADAAARLAVWILQMSERGMPLQSESYQGYAYSLLAMGSGAPPEIGTIRQMLSPYREVAL